MKRLVAVAAATVIAASSMVAMAAGDVAKGEQLAKRCTCHVKKNDLNGMAPDQFQGKMLAYKKGQGDNKAMIGVAEKLSEQDIADLAAYYAGLKK